MLAASMSEMNEPASAVSDRPASETGSDGFEAFFRAHHVRLLRALFLLTGNEQEAEELMQDSFVAVWERWDRVSGLDDPPGYLYRTAMNRFRSGLRRAARAARRALRPMAHADAFAAVDERDAVARAMATLSPRQRAALVLTEFLGYGSEEAGTILGVKPVTARVLSSQARAALRRAMEADHE
jgi:RNA polymerase sigma factor (sigma-70 family)